MAGKRQARANGKGSDGRDAVSGREAWSDVILVETPEPTISYRTGWVVYEESLTKGVLAGRGWNGAGLVNFYDGRI